ncbi:SGNH/GDSL hydrolase family protein [Tessaracoccus sp. OS52]|uniref:SGNH/GDSL hydrolase family protein n=1 Tax=Tessaracoccus sp. OS52 TaxID=2886691 RepID=UPI001D11983D|nr:SGNH/GDSL hydrolase family protein [Tessaracoccus sp. OS52]MCC2594363.1 SGNH/GDSL hydrolase family protein [Tessaracoccus sp. OS52]
MTDGGLRPVTGNVHLPVRSGPPDNLTDARSLTTRMRHELLVDASGLRFVFANWFNDLGRDSAGPNPITVGAEVVEADSVVTFDGAPTITLAPGEARISDPLDVDLRRGARFFSVTTVSAPPGGRIPLGPQTDALDGEGVGSGTPDGGRFRASTAHGYGPWQILAPAPSTDASPTLLVTGDSNAVGFGDRRGEACHFGWVRRAFRLPTVNLAVSGATARGTLGADSRRRRDELLRWTRPTLAVAALGTNDLQQGGPGLSEMQEILTAHWSELADRGMAVLACTLPPVTTSADGWHTVGGQSPTPGWEVREELNLWLRSRPGPLAGILDLAAALGTASSPHRWAPGLTADGLHPNPTGHAAAALVAAGGLPDPWPL